MDYKEKVIALLNSQELSKEQKEKLEEIFPELKESEDERIMKGLIGYFRAGKCENISSYHGISTNDILAWIEKQGEQKSIFEMKTPEESLNIDSDTYNKIVDECIYDEQKPADKVESKFKFGDWVVYDHRTYQVVELPKDGYINLGLRRNGKIEFVPSTYCRHWTIQDAKDGDVLCCESGWTCIFKALNSGNISFSSYCFMDGTGWFCGTGSESHTLDKAFIKAYNGNIYPATKEQCDTLMKAMADSGYEWDAEKKELKKIEQNLALSEEDEKKLLCICAWIKDYPRIADFKDEMYTVANNYVDWLKSLKDRVLPQPKQEWSEEDKENFELAIYLLEKAKEDAPDWLGDEQGLDVTD